MTGAGAVAFALFRASSQRSRLSAVSFRVRPLASTGIRYSTGPLGFSWRTTEWEKPSLRAVTTRSPPWTAPLYVAVEPLSSGAGSSPAQPMPSDCVPRATSTRGSPEPPSESVTSAAARLGLTAVPVSTSEVSMGCQRPAASLTRMGPVYERTDVLPSGSAYELVESVRSSRISISRFWSRANRCAVEDSWASAAPKAGMTAAGVLSGTAAAERPRPSEPRERRRPGRRRRGAVRPSAGPTAPRRRRTGIWSGSRGARSSMRRVLTWETSHHALTTPTHCPPSRYPFETSTLREAQLGKGGDVGRLRRFGPVLIV